MEYSLAIRVLIEMLTWLNLKNIMLSKRSHTRNITLCDSMYMKTSRKRLRVAWNWGEQGLTNIWA